MEIGRLEKPGGKGLFRTTPERLERRGQVDPLFVSDTESERMRTKGGRGSGGEGEVKRNGPQDEPKKNHR